MRTEKRRGHLAAGILLAALLCLSLAGCGQRETADTDPPPEAEGNAPGIPAEDTPEEAEALELLPPRDSVEAVFLWERGEISTPLGGDVYVPASQTEGEALTKLLYQADLEAFTPADPAGTSGAALAFRLRWPEGERFLRLLHDPAGEALYLGITDRAASLLDSAPPELNVYLQGPADALDWEALNQLDREIHSDTAEADLCGTVTDARTGERFTQSRAGSAQVQAILDGTLALSGSAEGEADLQYPVEFRVGGALYGVEPETLAFFRETAGQRMYGNVELDEMAVRVYLGLMEQQ